MSATHAVVVDPEAPGRLVIRPVPEPVPDRGEAVVRVRAISLNRGEVRRSGMAAAGWRPGWDLAGEVERSAGDGSGPRAGTRVVGLLLEGAWADRVAVPTHALAELPDKVTLAQAATLPVAGLTALHALGRREGGLLGRRVLVAPRVALATSRSSSHGSVAPTSPPAPGATSRRRPSASSALTRWWSAMKFPRHRATTS
jgi:NADPH2:quinone reductase